MPIRWAWIELGYAFRKATGYVVLAAWREVKVPNLMCSLPELESLETKCADVSDERCRKLTLDNWNRDVVVEGEERSMLVLYL